MILRLHGVTRSFGRFKARNDVLRGVDAVFERGRHYAILGARGSGKSVLMKLLSGLDLPTTGSIERRGAISLPVGVIGLIANRRTPRGLIEYFAALYDGDAREMAAFVAALTGMPDELDMDLRNLDSGRRSRLYFALGYAIPAQVYLFDNLFAVGDSAQRALYERAFMERRKSAGSIFATSDTRVVERVAEHALVLRDGRLHAFSSVADAIAFHTEAESAAPADVFARATALARAGSIDKARALLREHLTRSEATPEAYSMLADLSARAGDTKEAVDFAWAALDRGIESADPFIVLARVAEREGRHLDVLANAERALDVAPGYREAHVLLAHAYEAVGLNAEAAAAWREASAVTSNAMIALRRAVHNDLRAENWKGLLHSSEMALALNTNEIRMVECKLRAQLELQLWADARSTCLHLAQLDIEKAIVSIHRLFRVGNWIEAVEIVEALASNEMARLRASPGLSATKAFLRRVAMSQVATEHGDIVSRTLKLLEDIDPPD